MSRMIKVTPLDNFTLWIEFEQGHQILFNMQRRMNTLPYVAIHPLERFKKVEIEDQALCWHDTGAKEQSLLPIRLTLDNILFAIRD